MFSAIATEMVVAVVLSVVILAIAVASQGRLRHGLLMLLGAVPRQGPTLTSTIPRAEQHWSLLARLSDELDAPGALAPETSSPAPEKAAPRAA